MMFFFLFYLASEKKKKCKHKIDFICVPVAGPITFG